MNDEAVMFQMPVDAPAASFLMPPRAPNQSAEAKLLDAWSHVDHAHAEHKPARVIEIRNHVIDEQSKQKRPHEPVFVVACSCGDRVEISLQDVYEHTDGAGK